MKHRILYLVPFIAVFLAGCLGSTNTPAPVVSGTFSGQFRLFHRHTTTSPFDTLKANITLTLAPAPTNTFSVTGDTSTVIAGSKGTYQLASNGNFILFIDSTIPTTGTSSKAHLNGEYIYSYDGNSLQMVANSLDTLQVQYDLKKN
ncbi:MAG: hypothetical protein JSU01_18585 [Bacteroidetes bacterium]|nr:hypothetical protein [Bacteroidota bacterium]